MRRCERCGCLCDPGDLVNGVCDDCQEDERKKEENCEMALRMMRSSTKQMTLEDFIK